MDGGENNYVKFSMGFRVEFPVNWWLCLRWDIADRMSVRTPLLNIHRSQQSAEVDWVRGSAWMRIIRDRPCTHQTTSPTCSHRSPTYQHARRCGNGNLFLPPTERRFGDRAFSVAAPRVWNRLPTKLKLMRSSTTTFKRHLKTFLFNSAHSSHWL